MLIRSISKIFKPDSVAVFGASERHDSTGAVIFRNLLQGGFRGAIYLINPKYKEVQGVKAFSSMKEVGQPADVALIATPAPTVPQIIRDCGESGVPTAIIISAGFRDAGGQGRRLEEEVLSLARSKIEDAFRLAEEKISAVFDQQFRPLEEQIFQLEDELGGLRQHERSLARELGAVRTRVEPMEVGIEDHLLGLLQAAITSVTEDDEAAEPAPAP